MNFMVFILKMNLKKVFHTIVLIFLAAWFVATLWVIIQSRVSRFPEPPPDDRPVTCLRWEVLPCVLEIRKLAFDTHKAGEDRSFPEKLDALFRERTRNVPPCASSHANPFHVFVSPNVEDWLPPYGTRTNIYFSVFNYDWKVPLFSAENGIVMECSEKIPIPNQVAQNWFSYFCYWPFATDDSSKLFWQLPESSPLWNAEIAHDFGADKSLDPDSWTWLKVFSPKAK